MRNFTLFRSRRLLLMSFLTFATAIPSFAQNTVVDSLVRYAGNIYQFNEFFPQEKVYLQFDNTSYYSGESIWFKAFVVNASDLQIAQSKVLYVELISPKGEVLKQQKLKIVAGQADGVFTLIDSSTKQAREKRGMTNYPSGFYEIRAYTNYMLNFNKSTIFSRVFAVYEQPQTDGHFYEENPTINIRPTQTADFRPKTEEFKKINCSFHPEGGHLIKGKTSVIAFKVSDDTGFGVDAQGVITGNGTTFHTTHNGMGWFTYTPTDKTDKVEITVDGKTSTFSLPKAEDKGAVMTVTSLSPDSLNLLIDCTPQLYGKNLGIVVTCRGKLIGFHSIMAQKEPMEKIISLYHLPEGVCRIYLFDKDGSIYASRSVYHHNRDLKMPTLTVESDKKLFAPFEKIALSFSLKDGKGNPYQNRFCLSVRDTRGQANRLADDLRTSMLLSSDLKGFIEDPSWYFDSEDPEREQALDLLMLVQGWERYDWETMTGQKGFRERHRLETCLTLNGWIMNSTGKKPLDKVEVLAAIMPQDKTSTETYSLVTDSTGYFGFDIGCDFYNKARFTINANTTKKRIIGSDARIVLDRSLRPDIRNYLPQELVFTPSKSSYRYSSITPFASIKTEDDGLPTIINVNSGLLLPEVNIEEDRMYIDYYTFNAYDVVNDVETTLDKGDYSDDLYGYLLDKGFDVYIDTNQQCFVNGYPVFPYVHDSKRYLYNGAFGEMGSIDTKQIKSIIVFDRPMYLLNILPLCPLYEEHLRHSVTDLTGDSMLYERFILIDICTKEESELNSRKELFDLSKRITTVEGYSTPYQFYSPEYPDGPLIGEVDYRRTLYWNPNIMTDSIGNARIEFYNNSITSHFNIEAAGITGSGLPYILQTEF